MQKKIYNLITYSLLFNSNASIPKIHFIDIKVSKVFKSLILLTSLLVLLQSFLNKATL